MSAKILIRFDDICPTMDFEQFHIAETMMDEYQLKPLIGVVPDCKDEDLQISDVKNDFWDYVLALQKKGYTIAMHGLNHVFDSPHKGMVNNRVGSEFSGHSLEVQVEKIRKGKEILQSHGIETDIFFAPAHSYDDNTIKALSLCGFKYISDGKSSKAYEKYGVKLLPCRSGGCPKIPKHGYVTAVFHAHEWAWLNKKYCYDEFKTLLKNYHNDVVSFDEYRMQPVSNTMVQQLNEKLYVLYEYRVYAYLKKVYRFILRR